MGMAAPSVTLVFEAGPESGKSLRISTPRATIGRRKGEILIKDAEISGSHAEISIAGDKVLIKDLGSTNGTFINGKKLPTADLRDGDRLTIGQSKILVKIEGGASEAAMRATTRQDGPLSGGAPPRSNARLNSPERVAAKPAGNGNNNNKPIPAVTARPSPAPLARGGPGGVPKKAPPVNIDGIGALISEELEGFSEQTDSVIMDLARADEELKLPYRTKLMVEVLEGPDVGMRVDFPKGNMVIGRLNADVVLKDSDISRRHALIEAYTRDKIFIKDLASTNGTFVNGQKITYDKLKHGDKIRVGKSVLRFLVEEIK